MRFEAIKSQAKDLFREASFISHIHNQDEYELALALMDELIEDYDNQLPLIEILAAAIAQWQSSASEFEEFNRKIDDLDNGTSVLRTLMDQYQLGVADLPEIGTKSLVSKILNGSRCLTRNHIEALSKRFGLSPALFF